MARGTKTGARMAKALACGMLEDNGRLLFLKRIDAHNTERIELPCILVYSGSDPLSQLKGEFARQTGIDAEICEIAFETRHNIGSRRKKLWVPCLVFRAKTKNAKTKPSQEFSGFKWLSFREAKKWKLGRNAEWIMRI